MSNSVSAKKKTNVKLIDIFSVLFAILVAADQYFKDLVVKQIKPVGLKVIIKDFFSLFYCENTGSAFSLFADKAWGIYFLIAVSTILGCGIFALMIVSSKNSMPLLSVAFCLLSSGAIGNLIDRARLKYVIDFLRFDFGSYTFPIFNFADICAVLGTFLLIYIIVFRSKEFEAFWNILFKKKETEDAE